MFKDVVLHVATMPRIWFLPRKDRAVLAIICLIFWGGTIWQAATHDTAHASVFSLFGLGLLYLIFSLSNLLSGLKTAILQYKNGHADEAHPRALAELFAVLASMLIFNVAVLCIYLCRGTSFTPIDTISIGVDLFLVGILLITYGSEAIHHPIARGWLAIAGKTIPQLVTAGLFITRPSAAAGLALITLLGIDALSTLRFIPTLKSYLKDTKNRHVGGLLLGEAGNTISGLILTLAWLVAHTTSPL
jgi:hypothetical protein